MPKTVGWEWGLAQMSESGVLVKAGAKPAGQQAES